MPCCRQEAAAVQLSKNRFTLRRREAPPVDLFGAFQTQLRIVDAPHHFGPAAPALRQARGAAAAHESGDCPDDPAGGVESGGGFVPELAVLFIHEIALELGKPSQ